MLLLLHFRNWYYGENKTRSGDNEAKSHSDFAGIEVFVMLLYFTHDIVYKAPISISTPDLQMVVCFPFFISLNMIDNIQ